MNYNQKRHIELLKLKQDLENQRKNIFLENSEEYFELYEYNIAVHLHFLWQERDQIAELMEDFLNKKIDGEEMCDGVFGLRRKLINTCEEFELELISGSAKIKDFQLDRKAKDFSGFFTGLFCECDHFMEDYENDEFYTSIENGFLNFQNFFNGE